MCPPMNNMPGHFSGWSHDQPQPGSFFQRPREAEKRDPGNEVARKRLCSVPSFGGHIAASHDVTTSISGNGPDCKQPCPVLIDTPLLFLLPVIPRVLVPSFSCFHLLCDWGEAPEKEAGTYLVNLLFVECFETIISISMRVEHTRSVQCSVW